MEPPLLFNLWDVHYQRSLERTNIRSLVTRSLVNLVSIVVAIGQVGRLAYVNEFVEEAKTSGLVQRTIERARLRGVQVAPLLAQSG